MKTKIDHLICLLTLFSCLLPSLAQAANVFIVKVEIMNKVDKISPQDLQITISNKKRKISQKGLFDNLFLPKIMYHATFLDFTGIVAEVGDTFEVVAKVASGETVGNVSYTLTEGDIAVAVAEINLSIVIPEPEVAVIIPDPNLRAKLEQALGKGAGEPITTDELAGLSGTLNASKSNISDLTGLEHCINLAVLYLYDNEVSDIEALSNLTNLALLDLDVNQVSDISALSNLINLTGLYLGWNQISDISPLSNLINLTWLNLQANQVSDISALSNLRIDRLHLITDFQASTKVLAISVAVTLQDGKVTAPTEVRVQVENTDLTIQHQGLVDTENNYILTFFDPLTVVAQSGQQLHIRVTNLEGDIFNFQHILTSAEVARGYVKINLSLDLVPVWSMALQVQSVDPELDRHQLNFGMAEKADSGFDLGLDILSPPTPQPPIELYAYWQIEDTVAPRLLSDYRAEVDSAIYRLVIRADEQPFTLSWDAASLPPEFSRLQLKSVSNPDLEPINMKQQRAVTYEAQTQDYVFQLIVSKEQELTLATGWNLISLAGQPLLTDPVSLKGESQTAMLPMFRWNPSGFSYQQAKELKLGEGYWMLSLSQDGESLSLPLKAVDNYSVQLKAGWNLIGSVAQPFDFANAVDHPDGAIAAGSLYGWRAKGYSYQAADRIEPGQGYWVLAFEDCQLTVGGKANLPTAPQVLAEAEVLLRLKMSSGHWSQELELGMDQSATDSFESMDRPLPPSGPVEVEPQAYLIGDAYRLRRDVRPVSEEEISWQMRISSMDPVDLTIDSQQIPIGKELVIIKGQVETVLTAGGEMQLDSGDRELTVSLRSLPKVTQLLQNYPNPFNPETWIPYQLNQGSEVSLSAYSSEGKLVRQIDLGLKPAGNYQTTERAIYWDGRNDNGESVSSGVYFYRLQAGDYSQTRKMVILK